MYLKATTINKVTELFSKAWQMRASTESNTTTTITLILEQFTFQKEHFNKWCNCWERQK
jgi:hypothetical protein